MAADEGSVAAQAAALFSRCFDSAIPHTVLIDPMIHSAEKRPIPGLSFPECWQQNADSLTGADVSIDGRLVKSVASVTALSINDGRKLVLVGVLLDDARVHQANPPALKVVVALDGTEHDLAITPAEHGDRIDVIVRRPSQLMVVVGTETTIGEPQRPTLPSDGVEIATVCVYRYALHITNANITNV